MDAKDIEKILIEEAAAILSRDAAKIAPDELLNVLGIDSLGFVELLVFIEKRFNLKLIESGLDRKDFKSIRSLATCISNMYQE